MVEIDRGQFWVGKNAFGNKIHFLKDKPILSGIYIEIQLLVSFVRWVGVWSGLS